MYDKLAMHYDHFVDWKSRLAFEMPFIQEQLALLPGEPENLKLMDTASGTGQHAIALARLGYQVSASDLYPQMLNIANTNALAADVNIRLKTAGFGNIAEAFPGESFDAVLCLGNSLPHVKSLADLQHTLQDFAALMAPNALLLLQQRNFDAVMRARNRFMEPQSQQTADQEWLFFRFYDFEPNGTIQFSILTLTRKPGSRWETSLTSTHLLPILFADMQNALEMAGFEQLRFYGNLKGEAFDPAQSGDLIVVARKAK
ncbi:MAG TPA: methyltransferase domain-containing protein [Anaerolineaceae bacterium]|jgi:2-polyprenyl-3-methyl-5-hydroxy-6-metoxy-1,4-benzoquinol methylase|nr:methyltransferase domain-containing protein [Anaerolineaceae bacterium]